METNSKSFSVHDAIKPLYWISRFLLIWPFKYQNNYQIISLSRFNKMIAIILIAAFIWAFKWNTETILLDEDYWKSFIITTLLSAGPVNFNTIYSIAKETFVCIKSNTSFYVQLDLIHKSYTSFDSSRVYRNLQKKVLKNLVGFLFISTLLITVEIVCLYLFLSFPLYSVVVASSNQLYFAIIFIQIITELDILQQHFSSLNLELEKYNSSHITNKSGLQNIKMISHIYGKLCNIIKGFNDRRGFQIILLICIVICLVINSLYSRVIVRTIPEIETTNRTLSVIFDIKEMVSILFFCVSVFPIFINIIRFL